MVIYLYTAVPPSSFLEKVHRSLNDKVKVKCIRLLNMPCWRFRYKLLGSVYHYNDFKHSNVGDVALSQGIKSQLHTIPFFCDAEFRYIQWGTIDQTMIQQINDSTALFVIAGSGYIHLDHNVEQQLNPLFIRDQPLIKNIKVSRISYGIGLNCNLANGQPCSKLNEASSASFSDFCHSLSLISVRDKLAYSLVRSFNKPCALMLDPAFFLGTNKTLSTNTDKVLKVGLNLALHGPNSFVLFNEKAKEIIKGLHTYQTHSKCEYIYFVHSHSELYVVELLKLSGIKISAIVTGSPDKLLHEYININMHISQMMHSAILAMSFGTPCINLAYDVKSIEMYKLMDLEEYYVPIHSISGCALEAKIELLVNNLKMVQNKIAIKKREYEIKKQAFLDSIEKLLSD